MNENRHSYKADLLERLKDLRYAELYLDAASRESQESFFLALRDVAEARLGIHQLALDADVNRENLYRLLSEEGNPRYSTLKPVVNALGMYVTVRLTQMPTVSSGTFGATNTCVQAAPEAAQEPADNPGDGSAHLSIAQREIVGAMATPTGEGQIKYKEDVLEANSQLALAA